MKKPNYQILSFIFLLMAVVSGKAQCNTSQYSQQCITKVQDGFTFLKSFSIDAGNSKDKVEYSYVFSKDTEYFLNVCSENNDADDIIVTIYDSNRKVVSTNYVNNKFFPAIIFACKSTGIYYITYTFNKSPKLCGGSVLAFRR